MFLQKLDPGLKFKVQKENSEHVTISSEFILAT